MMKTTLHYLLLTTLAATASAFTNVVQNEICRTCTELKMANDKDLIRWARASRTASADDRSVELKRPLGLVLEEDDSGNVYVETVAPRGNAARSGMIKEGDIVVMCSATFGDQLWSTRGVGLTRVLSAIRVRAGPTVTLVLESPADRERKAKMTTKAAKAAEEARARAKEKKDQLLTQLEADELKLKKGKFLGLF
mmetsp:Transcript_26375/g.40835  ORF Transcript_26375/g.40835 Transcript_26375/m.40835 type:complete len:195 (+) Transcript_26375:78-662(+)|eukprot:CAMPEP_0196811038 /NCGR_PEP_ID=MMETSP1362-20130617/16912_1 /TAXON_ID=163516 /ORGANISM="Leptocylindrus danicus, Strain CCMP1856" /LENGTH=194 /DNA_ID=CAMNT_0042186279 /DNA_START=51 /DNA_END=635 /DNA_ORIENTATION=-